MLRFVILGWLSLSSSACVIGRAERPSQLETVQGPSSAAVTGSPIAAPISPDNSEAPEPAQAPTPDSVWVRGYWHWDGVRYVWQRGRWQHE